MRFTPKWWCAGIRGNTLVLVMAAKSIGLSGSRRPVSIISCNVLRDKGGYCLLVLEKEIKFAEAS